MNGETPNPTPAQELRHLRVTIAKLEADFTFLEINPGLISYSYSWGWRIRFGPKDHSNSFASIRACIAYDRKELRKKAAKKGGR